MNKRTVSPAAAVLIAVVALLVGLQAPAVAYQTTALAHKISGKTLKPNSVTGKQIKESTLGTVPRAKTAATATHATTATTALTATTAESLPPLVWHPITTFQNGWTYDSANEPLLRKPAYAVDAQGIVHLQGVIHNSDSSKVGLVAFSLPADVMPPVGSQEYLLVNSSSAVGILCLSQDDVFIDDGPFATAAQVANQTSLEGVTFAIN